MRDTEDTRKPRGKCIQIKGTADDALIHRVEAYAAKRGVAVATIARMLIKDQLDTIARWGERGE
jgi:dihydroxyacetone kinase